MSNANNLRLCNKTVWRYNITQSYKVKQYAIYLIYIYLKLFIILNSTLIVKILYSYKILLMREWTQKSTDVLYTQEKKQSGKK